ncbi:MAG TPA: adenylate/guanylate cyclase domain-containing protein [Gaiellaceae bacterium]|nr:adenylate/guanylate cyclase domain-containing protein [Gaiellaceae bacterium]
MAGISAEQIAELVPCSLEQVRRLEELGILGPHREDGLFKPAAVHVVRLMDAFEEAGVSLEDIGRGVAEGELSFPLGLFLPDPAAMSGTYETLGAELDRSPELLRRLSRELGLPPLPDDRIRDEDAELLTLVVSKLDLADDEDLSRFARLYGGAMQRLVPSGLQWFDRTVRQRVATWGLPDAERDTVVYQRGGQFADVVATVVPWLQRRHREHAVLDYLVSVTEASMEERGMTPAQPKRPPAIAFLDLTGYTALAEEHGDEAAAELAVGLAGIVDEAAREYGGRPVKWLGDGVMFHFADPARAVVGGLELIEQTESAVSVPARIGINAGAVVAHEGDYFGRTVNVAARIADYARPHEVLVSEEARQSADATDVRFELIGDVPLKGVSRSVRLHRVTRAA